MTGITVQASTAQLMKAWAFKKPGPRLVTPKKRSEKPLRCSDLMPIALKGFSGSHKLFWP